MNRLLLALLLFPLPAAAQLAAPTFFDTSAPAITYNTPTVFPIGGPTGATICYGINVTPTAATAGTCDTKSGEFTYSNPITISGTGTWNAIATQAGQTNSSVTTVAFTIATFSVPAGTYSFSPVVTLYPDYIHVGGTACYTLDGSTPTESGNACTHGTTYSGPITVSSSATLSVLFTRAGQSDSSVLTAAYTLTGAAKTWYVNSAIGGTRYSSNYTTGLCDGSANTAPVGSTPNQHCAFSDFRMLYQDGTYTYGPDLSGCGASCEFPSWGWVIAGGDTVIVEGDNAGGVAYRIGWNTPNASTYCTSGYNCWGITGDNGGSGMPPPPSGSASQPTRILGQNYAACSTGNATNHSLLTQLFGGYGVSYDLQLDGASNVQLECLEITAHTQAVAGTNGTCGLQGVPLYPTGCSKSSPLSDFDGAGLHFNVQTGNLLLQDIYIHGHKGSGISGPIGGTVTMIRDYMGFNAFAGWDFSGGNSYDIPNASTAAINASYVTQIGNGCDEQYPLVNSYPAVACHDTNSGGFGDSWSGQDSYLASFTCNYCIQMYNTKDGWIGPHFAVETTLAENSVSIGNMGQQLKFDVQGGGTALFVNNLIVGNCNRMSETVPGAAQNFAAAAAFTATGSGTNLTVSSVSGVLTVGSIIGGYGIPLGTTIVSQSSGTTGGAGVYVTSVATTAAGTPALMGLEGSYLTGFCRASGDVITPYSDTGSTILFGNNTIVAYSPTIFDMSVCFGSCGAFTFKNNLINGYLNTDPTYTSTIGNGQVPALYYEAPGGTVATNQIEYNIRNGDTCGGTINCASPQMLSQPTTPMTLEPQLDVFNPTPTGNSFNLTSGSPAIGAGTTYTGLPSTDYYGVATTSPPVIGGVNYVAAPSYSGSYGIGFSCTGCSIH